MRARVVYHDGSVEKLTEVAQVTETSESFVFYRRDDDKWGPLSYPKNGGGVKFVQVTWHAE